MNISTNERFYRHVLKSSKCWEWQGSLVDGYGSFSLRDKTYKSHRMAWMLRRGDIPDGLYVLHHCDNRKCVKISHLFLGTQQDNMDDMRRKGRSNFRRGSAVKQAKLNEGQVRNIKRMIKMKLHTNRYIAIKYGVSFSAIWSIAHNISWVAV